jgi:uncharacterized membrane protein YhhN
MIGLHKFQAVLNARSQIFSIFYFLIGFTYILLPVVPFYIPPLAVKALIIPLLILIFKMTIKKDNTLSNRLIFIALFFSWAGDVALGIKWRQETLFMTGLIFFLLTHIFYLIAFIRTPGRNLLPKHFFYALIPLLLYGLILLYILYDDLGEMKVPVTIYTTVILAMVAAAINRTGKVNRTSYYMVLIGALLFLSSDSMLAIDKFSHSFPFGSPLIMFTYIAGQYLIVTGYLVGLRIPHTHPLN